MPGMADIFKIIIHFIVRSFLNNDREILAYWQQLFNEENLIKHLRVAHWIVLLRKTQFHRNCTNVQFAMTKVN
jgi:hypothetical protein